MQSNLPLRLAFDLAAAGLLLFGFSYWWLGNVAHELAGSAMFVLLAGHNVFNRRFFGRVAKTKREPWALLNVAVTAFLLFTMVTLLVSSVLISDALSGFILPLAGFDARQIHALAAYWALVIVAVHLGFRWPMIMGFARDSCGLRSSSATRIWTLRLIAGAMAIQGLWSSHVLGLCTKLTMQVSLDWWNFEVSVIPFFVHLLAVASLYICLSYYVTKWLRYIQRETSPASFKAARS